MQERYLMRHGKTIYSFSINVYFSTKGQDIFFYINYLYIYLLAHGFGINIALHILNVSKWLDNKISYCQRSRSKYFKRLS